MDNNQKIVVDNANAPKAPITEDKDIANLVNKNINKDKPTFSMSGKDAVVTPEVGAGEDAPSENFQQPVQEKSILVTDPVDEVPKVEVKKTPEKKDDIRPEKKNSETPAAAETKPEKKASRAKINAARQLMGETPLEAEPQAETKVETSLAESKPVVSELPADVKERLEKYSSIEQENMTLKEKAALLDNPLVQRLLEVAGDGDIKKFVQKLDLTDYDGMSDESIFEIGLKKKNLSAEQIEEAMADFDALPSYKKVLETQSTRDELKKAADEKNNTLLSTPSVSPDQIKYKQEQERAALTALDGLTKKLAEKGYYDLYVPDTDSLEQIRQYALTNPVVVTKDGKQSYDMGKTIENALWNIPSERSKFLRVFGETKKLEGYEEKIRERVRPNPENFTPGSHSNQKQTFSDAMKAQGIVTPVSTN